MNADGAEPRKLLSVSPDRVHDSPLAWFPDGRRIAFANRSPVDGGFSIQSYDLATRQTQVILSDPRGGPFCITREGRITYSLLEDPPNEKSANLWEVGIDLQTAQIRGTPRRLTNWPRSMFGGLSSSRDGRRLLFLRLQHQNSVYIGQLDGSDDRLVNPRRFSFEQWTNWPTGWSRDSQTVFFNSDSLGRPDVFRQPIEGRVVEALAEGIGERRDARVSPDGKWLLYLEWPWDKGNVSGGGGRLMRAGANGEPAQPVFRVAGYSKRIRTEPLVSISGEGHPAFRCPFQPSGPCVLSEEIQGLVVFTAFDPVEGRGKVLAELPASRLNFWDLSPDSRWIAMGKNEETRGVIHLVSLAGEASREIQVENWTHLLSVAWASDGSALFATAFASTGAPLLRVGLDGKTHMLYRGLKYVENPVASPDGRYLAFGEMTQDGNAWVLDIDR